VQREIDLTQSDLRDGATKQACSSWLCSAWLRVACNAECSGRVPFSCGECTPFSWCVCVSDADGIPNAHDPYTPAASSAHIVGVGKMYVNNSMYACDFVDSADVATKPWAYPVDKREK